MSKYKLEIEKLAENKDNGLTMKWSKDCTLSDKNKRMIEWHMMNKKRPARTIEKTAGKLDENNIPTFDVNFTPTNEDLKYSHYKNKGNKTIFTKYVDENGKTVGAAPITGRIADGASSAKETLKKGSKSFKSKSKRFAGAISDRIPRDPRYIPLALGAGAIGAGALSVGNTAKNIIANKSDDEWTNKMREQGLKYVQPDISLLGRGLRNKNVSIADPIAKQLKRDGDTKALNAYKNKRRDQRRDNRNELTKLSQKTGLRVAANTLGTLGGVALLNKKMKTKAMLGDVKNVARYATARNAMIPVNHIANAGLVASLAAKGVGMNKKNNIKFYESLTDREREIFEDTFGKK